MLYQDKSKIDFLDGNSGPVYYDWKGYVSFGLDIDGNFTSPGLKIQGSSNGSDWTDVLTIKDGAVVSDNEINDAGHYLANIASFEQGRLMNTSGWSGNLRASANMGTAPVNYVLGLNP